MANTNWKNPNAAAKPTRQSRQAAGKRSTEDSPALRYRRYDRGGSKDPPKSLVGTAMRTKAKHKSPPERKGACPVIQETNVDPPAIPATLGFIHDPLHQFNQTLCLISDVRLTIMIESNIMRQGEFPKSVPANFIFIAKQNGKGDWCRVAVGCSSIARI